MLGRGIDDPTGADGSPGHRAGLGLLDVQTTMSATKTVRLIEGRCARTGHRVSGYEIHVGETTGGDCARPAYELEGRPEGAQSPDGLIEGSYVHGVFGADEFRRAWLQRVWESVGRSGRFVSATSTLDYAATVDQSLDDLADGVEAALDVDALFDCAAVPHLP